MDDLGKRGKAVGRARRVREHVDVRGVEGVVDTHDEHGRIGGRRRDDDLRMGGRV